MVVSFLLYARSRYFLFMYLECNFLVYYRSVIWLRVHFKSYSRDNPRFFLATMKRGAEKYLTKDDDALHDEAEVLLLSLHKTFYCTHHPSFHQEASSEGPHKADDAVLATRKLVHHSVIYALLSDTRYLYRIRALPKRVGGSPAPSPSTNGNGITDVRLC